MGRQFNASNMRLAPALVSYYTKILRALTFSTAPTRPERARSFLATSPVKYLSSILGGNASSTSVNELSTSAKSLRPPLINIANLSPPMLSRSNSSRVETLSLNGSVRTRDGMAAEEDRPENPLVRLEETFTGYVAALQARKGDFVGRLLQNRAGADELAINEVYNKLFSNPFDWEHVINFAPEVIFAAFEKFTRIAWGEQIGPIMAIKTLDALQERASRNVPGGFADFVNYLFQDMAPQNRRAFTALIKLLADLLDGCGNDGDRGQLTLAFAELLVTEGVPHNYMNLLDRLVDDCDRIFDEVPMVSSFQLHASPFDSITSNSRSHKSATGSLTSNTSSLRRKLGFDNLLRQNSKNDTDRPSMWRSLSKHRNPAAGESSSLSKASVGRSRSIDANMHTAPNKLRRPQSRDRPPVAGAFDDSSRPNSSHNRPNSSQRLETIGEPDVEPPAEKHGRSKRRSSLSDLRTLMGAATIHDEDDAMPMPTPLPTAPLPEAPLPTAPLFTVPSYSKPVKEPPTPLRLTKQTSEKLNVATPSRVSALLSPSRIPISPMTSTMQSPRQKENISEALHKIMASPPPSAAPTESTYPRPRRPHAKTLSTSHIPLLRPARSAPMAEAEGRPQTSSGRPQTSAGLQHSPSKSSHQRLRLQSPTKLRERLNGEKQALEDVDASLKSELSRIADDMARLNGGAELRKIQASLKAIEERIPKVIGELDEKFWSIEKAMDTTMKTNEAKVKAIDQLYREAMVENEMQFEKFHSELGKIVKAIKGKPGRESQEELVAKIKEQSEEIARQKKDNARLKRENVSLRALLKGGEE